MLAPGLLIKGLITRINMVKTLFILLLLFFTGCKLVPGSYDPADLDAIDQFNGLSHYCGTFGLPNWEADYTVTVELLTTAPVTIGSEVTQIRVTGLPVGPAPACFVPALVPPILNGLLTETYTVTEKRIIENGCTQLAGSNSTSGNTVVFKYDCLSDSPRLTILDTNRITVSFVGP